MKWIGQHIVDLIARFRGDIYLEGLATTTESSVLVVDSSGKVSKNTSVGGDITSVVAGTGLNGGATSGVATVNVDATQSGIHTITNTGLKAGRDSHNFFDFGTDNQIEFTVSESQLITFKASGEIVAGSLDASRGVRMADDPASASVANVGTQRYRATANDSYVEMCMQTGATAYAWVIIKQNTW